MLCFAYHVDSHGQNLVTTPQADDFPGQQIRPATPAETTALRKGVKAFPEALIQQGMTKIGDLNLKKLSKEIDQVKISVNMSNQAIVGSGVRVGSVYLTKTKSIVVNVNHLQNEILKIAPATSLVVLHEELGALGYPDDNYQLSSSMAALYIVNTDKVASPETLKMFQDTVADYTRRAKKTTEDRSFVEGGVTGVGGGGVGGIPLMKAYIFQLLLEDPSPLFAEWRKDNKFLSYFMNLRLEEMSPFIPKDSLKLQDGILYAQIEGQPSLILETKFMDHLLSIDATGKKTFSLEAATKVAMTARAMFQVGLK